MHATRALVLVVPLLTALACGGRYDPGVGGGGGSSSGGSSGGGSSSGGSSSGSSSGGNPTCPAPSRVSQSLPCSDIGDTCPSTDPTYDCNGNKTGVVDCSCAGNGVWECLVSETPCPPPNVCPTPSSIQEGGACSVGQNLTCQSTIPEYGCNGQIEGYASCSCEGGRWLCAAGAPFCPDVQPGCPAPASVEQGVSCASLGQQCAGHPQDCGGQTFYDAFECDNYVWNDIAATSCTGEAGAVDGGFVDAGWADASSD